MCDKRQKNQLVLAFTEEGRSEAPKTSQEGTESRTAKCETERPAHHEQWMEEVCERENCWQAYKRVKANKGSPGIDGMKVGELSGYLAALALHTFYTERPENSVVTTEAVEVAAPKPNLCLTLTNTIVARTKYPAFRQADNRNNTVAP